MQDRTHAEQTPTVNQDGWVRVNDEKNQGMTAARHTQVNGQLSKRFGFKDTPEVGAMQAPKHVV